MKRDDTVYLQHILDAIARIEEYLQDPCVKLKGVAFWSTI